MKLSSARTLSAAALLSIACVSSVSAQVIQNTGQGAQGAVDPNWTVNGGDARIISDGNLPGAWVESATSRWISIADSPYQPVGVYTYATTFDLTGYDASTAALSGRWTADDYASLYLNGNLLGAINGTWAYFTSFSVNASSGYFVNGVNTLSVALGNGDGFYDGLNVDELSVKADAVVATPEPASVALLATGLIGLAAAVRRRPAR